MQKLSKSLLKWQNFNQDLAKIPAYEKRINFSSPQKEQIQRLRCKPTTSNG